MGGTVVVAPGETKELRLEPNLIEIPTTAVRAELRMQKVCSVVEISGGVEGGECWWIPSRTADLGRLLRRHACRSDSDARGADDVADHRM
jgi:hypothetical protein